MMKLDDEFLISPQTMSFVDLPLDLLPLLFAAVTARDTMYRLCLVSRQFDSIFRPKLYATVHLFGKDLAVVESLFTTLRQSEHLCRLVQRLDVRVFPLSLLVAERERMNALAAEVLRRCRSLRSLVWTRRGSLTDAYVPSSLRWSDTTQRA